MLMAPRVERCGDRAVVVKRAGPAHTSALRAEAERLERAGHPGVTQLLGSESTPAGWELRTAHAGRPAASLHRPEARLVASIVSSAATTLADLHEIGIVHGRIDGSHVLVGEKGRAILCGFGDGSTGARPEDDVAALGALLGALLAGDEEPEPIPERRWRRRRAWAGWERRALLLVADRASADPPTRRPTARRLAAAIAEAVPEIASLDPPLPRHRVGPAVDADKSMRTRVLMDAGERRPGPPARWLAMAAAAVVAGAVALEVARSSPPETGPAMVEPAAGPAAHDTTPNPRIDAGPVPTSVVAAGRRYRVGQAGDEMILGDWDCDGTETPALLRPSTGEVFVFPRWIEKARLAVEPVLTVPGADALLSEPTPDGCAGLAVRTSAGDVLPVVEAAR